MNRRSALISGLSTLLITPSVAASIARELPQQPMSPKERADFHLAEFSRAMAEQMPADAHTWGASVGGDAAGVVWDKRFVSYRIPDPEIAQQGKLLMIDRMVMVGETP